MNIAKELDKIGEFVPAGFETPAYWKISENIKVCQKPETKKFWCSLEMWGGDWYVNVGMINLSLTSDWEILKDRINKLKKLEVDFKNE